MAGCGHERIDKGLEGIDVVVLMLLSKNAARVRMRHSGSADVLSSVADEHVEWVPDSFAFQRVNNQPPVLL